MFAVNQLLINILLVAILSTAPTTADLTAENPCTSKSKCNECIETPTCAWNFEPEESFGNQPRCYQPAAPHGNYSADYQFMPNNLFHILSTQPLNSINDDGDRIQISPQKVDVKLRAGESYSFKIQYVEVEDYPVDLYFLMDFSTSMRDEREKLTLLGNQILATMRNLTSNLQIGLGSYVHSDDRLINSCTDCATLSYGFRNEMKLSKNYSRFTDFLEHPTVSNELSPTEHEMDLFNAITQAIVCKNQIGWRNEARKILVVVTNHGVPDTVTNFNDHFCHVGNDGNYDWTTSATPESLNISELNLIVKQTAINIIFAVPDDQIDDYKELSNHIEGSSVGTLSSDYSNMEDLVTEKYEQITSTVEMKDNTTHEINYYSKCLNALTDEKETNICSGFKTRQVIDFRLEMNIKECPKDRKKWKETIAVYAVGVRQGLIIDLEMFCSCPEDFY